MILKSIPDYENYKISENGEVYKGEKKLKLELKKCGYYYCGLTKNKKRKSFRVHRLVALTFIENPNNFDIVHHKDGNKLNNHVSNLEWTTISRNTKLAFKSGSAINKKGIEDSQSIQVAVFLKNGDFFGVFESVRQASEVTGISQGNVAAWVRGEIKSSRKGFIFKKITREEYFKCNDHLDREYLLSEILNREAPDIS